LKKYKAQLQIGSLEGKAPPPPEPKKEEPKKEEQVVPMQAGPVAPAPTSEVHEAKEALETFGDLIPFGDPAWYQGVSYSLSWD